MHSPFSPPQFHAYISTHTKAHLYTYKNTHSPQDMVWQPPQRSQAFFLDEKKKKGCCSYVQRQYAGQVTLTGAVTGACSLCPAAALLVHQEHGEDSIELTFCYFVPPFFFSKLCCLRLTLCQAACEIIARDSCNHWSSKVQMHRSSSSTATQSHDKLWLRTQ